MVGPDKQPLRVTVEFTYGADVFEGDPTDSFEIARLEKMVLDEELVDEIRLLIPDAGNFTVKVVPA